MKTSPTPGRKMVESSTGMRSSSENHGKPWVFNGFFPPLLNLCLRGGLGWWFGSLGIDGFVNLEKTKNIKPCKQ